jgi:hypothetical protein
MSEPEIRPDSKTPPETGCAHSTPPEPKRPSADERPYEGASLDLPLSSPA